MRVIFWISLYFILFTYAGYPLILYLWARILPRRVQRGRSDPPPFVSVVIAARNEAHNIGRRIDNLLGQDYPPERLEIVVASDGSTDGTNEIVRGYIEREGAAVEAGGKRRPRIRLFTHEINGGKTHALNRGIKEAAGELIVFADARQEFNREAVTELVSNFADSSVGSVTGELVFFEDSHSTVKAEMGFYWRMEKWIRRTESTIHSTAGATGCIYAVRRALVEPLPEGTILDDVLVPMRIVLGGRRNVYDGRAVARDVYSKDLGHEKRRKVRTLYGNYQLLRLAPDLLSPAGNPIFFQFFCHKIMRLFVPLFFITLIISAIAAQGAVYKLALVAAAALLLLPLADRWAVGVPVLGRLAAAARTFVSLNYFALLAFLLLLRPGKKDVW